MPTTRICRRGPEARPHPRQAAEPTSSTCPRGCSACRRPPRTAPAPTSATTAASRVSPSCARSSPTCSASTSTRSSPRATPASADDAPDVTCLMLPRRPRLAAAVVAGGAGVKFVCPVPGYDRHFSMLAELRHRDGDRADARRRSGRRRRSPSAGRATTRAVKGMWLVPTYANPTGSVVSEEVAADADGDADRGPGLPDPLGQRLRVPPPDRASRPRAPTRSSLASGLRPPQPADHVRVDLEDHLRRRRGRRARGVDREQDLVPPATSRSPPSAPTRSTSCAHVEFFGTPTASATHMRMHREIIAPKFAAVDAALTAELDGLGIATWSRPTGGYFVNLDVLDGTATRVVSWPSRPASPSRPPARRSPTARTPRPQHPPRPHLPRARRGRDRHGRRGHLRRAGGRRATVE